MVDKISKFLNTLRTRELISIRSIIKQIERGDLRNLDIKKLHGRKHSFRTRKGRIRIIFKQKRSTYEIVSVKIRSERTYK